MKKCAYCATENRDEAIFCTHCRHPLGKARTAKMPGTGALLLSLAALLMLFAAGYFFLSARLPLISEPTATPAFPLAGPVPTRTLEPETIGACTREATVHVRRGPGTQYETIGGLPSGTCLMILGRDAGGTWVFMVSNDHKTGWVAISALDHIGDLSRVSVRGPSPLASSARPTLSSAEIAHGAKAYLTEIVATNLPQSRFSKYKLPCFETADRVGQQVSCRIEKAYCDYLPDLEGSPTLCSDLPHPDHSFTLIVFDADWSRYDGQCILVSGYLEIARGALQIEALDRDQVSLCD